MSRPDPEVYQKRFWADYDKDEYWCPDCRSARTEINQFEVHHIDGNPENNARANLVGLCQSCHHDRHGIDPANDGHWSESYFHEWRSDQTPLKYI